MEDAPKNKKQIILLVTTVNDLAMVKKICLPEHLVMDNILPRLPLKSLARFKAVSKHWFSFISAPQFSEKRLKLAPPPPNFILLDRDNCPPRMFVLLYDHQSRDVAKLVDVHCSELEKNHNDYHIVGSCNGLVCLDVVKLGTFALWNPLTTHYQLLPNSFRTDDYYIQIHVSGFGYLSSADDYKVLCIYLKYAMVAGAVALFYMFSLRDGEWTRLTHLEGPKYGRSLVAVEGFYFDDSLYWPKEIESGLGVFRFGLSSYRMKQLPGTHWLRDYNQIKKMCNFRGDLSLCCSKRSRDEWDLWVFQKKGIIRTWHKLYSIDTTIFSVLAFSHCGMLLAEHLGRLKLLEISALRNSDDLPEGVDYDGNIRELVACPHAESLVDCLIKKKP